MESKEPVSGVNETGSNGNSGTFWHIFLEPSRCFEGLNLKPRWLIPMILCVIMAFATSFLIYSRIDMEHVIREQIASSQSASQLTEEQIQQQVEMGAKFGKVSSLRRLIFTMSIGHARTLFPRGQRPLAMFISTWPAAIRRAPSSPAANTSRCETKSWPPCVNGRR